jgi:hypothetical protein
MPLTAGYMEMSTKHVKIGLDKARVGTYWEEQESVAIDLHEQKIYFEDGSEERYIELRSWLDWSGNEHHKTLVDGKIIRLDGPPLDIVHMIVEFV